MVTQQNSLMGKFHFSSLAVNQLNLQPIFNILNMFGNRRLSIIKSFGRLGIIQLFS